MGRMMIGFTGAFGSGTTFLATNFFEKQGYIKCSLSKILKEQYTQEYGKEYTRQDLQEYGNTVRKDDPAKLAALADIKYIVPNDGKNIVIESIRNPAELKYFRDKYSEFILIGVFADYDVRWNRVKQSYNGSKDLFDRDEQKDKGNSEPTYGQKISDCFFESDLILSNNDEIAIDGENEAYQNMQKKIEGYLKALKDPSKSNPTLKETLMAAAYTSGRRSKCRKRKVGAVIADQYDRIISSGFNGVPFGLKECSRKYGDCYRDKKREEISNKICSQIQTDVPEEELSEKTISGVKTNVKSNVKLLELCRALHGEESAILNLVGRGVDLRDSTIYVTTYPCNLCANKIVQVGIKKVVYFEPYPVAEAKEVFKDAKIVAEPFEGVTFRAFFKFYQYEP